jgi:hypothetical protein
VSWTRAADPNPHENIEYSVEWSADSAFSPDFTFSVTTSDTFYFITGLAEELDELPDDTTIYWRVKSINYFDQYTWANNDSSGWSFSVFLFDPPSPFDLIGPSEGDTCWTLDTTLTWNISTDPDLNDSVFYDVWMDTLEDLTTKWLAADSIDDTTLYVTDLQDDHIYFWTVRATDNNTDGTWANDTLSFVAFEYINALKDDPVIDLPLEYSISAVYPNPFNSTLTVTIALPEPSTLTLKIFDMLGREIDTIADNSYSAGYHLFSFNAQDQSSGIYFIQAGVTGKMNEIRKVVLIK